MNERLKKLIIPEDDRDSLTDELDQLKENVVTTTPARSLQQLSPVVARPQPVNMSPRLAPKASHEDEGESVHQANSAASLKEPPKLHLLPVLAVLLNKTVQQETRLESLRWLLWLHQQLPKRVCGACLMCDWQVLSVGTCNAFLCVWCVYVCVWCVYVCVCGVCVY